MKTLNMRLSAIAVTIALLMAASVAQAQFALFSEKDELEAGKKADSQIQQQQRISSDRYYNRMVDHLGRRLVSVCERPNLPWTFRVIDSRELNAFSVPGYVYVNSGLIDSIRDDQDALAGVIAHEIGHTCGKHAVRSMEKQTVGGLLVGLLGSRNKNTGGLASVAANLIFLGYSRDQENDADKRAVRYRARAGYDPNGLVRFFEMLQSKEGSGGGGPVTYFRTHPPTGDRIHRVKQNNEVEQSNRANGRDRESGAEFDTRPYRNRDRRTSGSRYDPSDRDR
jgi:predicted Zn-dependent protease